MKLYPTFVWWLHKFFFSWISSGDKLLTMHFIVGYPVE
uniref:Uncharacterized protein n=1 Tax=Arundo donax TaxID=35708 RepID=A0A0A9HRC5_ARUDO